MKKQTEQIVKKQLNYYGFTLEFSKILSYIYTFSYLITLILCWITDLFCIQTNLHELLDFVLTPTQIVVVFYFSSKTIEKVSLNVANYMAKKLEIRQQSDGYGYGDYGYNNYGGYGSNYTETYSSETQSDTIRPEEDQKGEM